MSSDNSKKGRMKRFGHHMIKDMDVKTMSYVMVIVVLVAVIAATVAWFTYVRAVRSTNLGLSTASSDVLKVAVEPGGEDILTLEEMGKSVTVTNEMPIYNNVSTYETTDNNGEKVTKTQLAPGVYGAIKLYITSLNKSITRYQISPLTLLTYVDGSCDQVDENGELLEALDTTGQTTDQDTIEKVAAKISDLRNIASSHILFFQSKEGTTYQNQITETVPMTGALEYDTEKSVTIYWYWPYEYKDIPIGVTGQSADTYDEEDTLLGTYCKDMRMQLKVGGLGEEDKTASE